ncbi:hypothetical protein [Kitasatospora sp. NPDC091207]
MPGLLTLVQSVQVVAGLLVLVVGTLALVERAAASPSGAKAADVESAR